MTILLLSLLPVAATDLPFAAAVFSAAIITAAVGDKHTMIGKRTQQKDHTTTTSKRTHAIKKVQWKDQMAANQ